VLPWQVSFVASVLWRGPVSGGAPCLDLTLLLLVVGTKRINLRPCVRQQVRSSGVCWTGTSSTSNCSVAADSSCGAQQQLLDTSRLASTYVPVSWSTPAALGTSTEMQQCTGGYLTTSDLDCQHTDAASNHVPDSSTIKRACVTVVVQPALQQLAQPTLLAACLSPPQTTPSIKYLTLFLTPSCPLLLLPCLSMPQILRAPAAAAVDAPAVPIGQLPLEQRQALAEQWGYKTIGAELPDGVSLTDIVKSMPQEVRSVLCFGLLCWPQEARIALRCAGFGVVHMPSLADARGTGCRMCVGLLSTVRTGRGCLALKRGLLQLPTQYSYLQWTHQMRTGLDRLATAACAWAHC
jgi:hypothetical protein